MKFYSSGMYVRLAFAVAVHVDPDLLLVDEVLAVGDEAFQRKCLDKIKSFQREGRTIVLVTHSLDQVRDICDRAILLEAGRVVIDGTPLDALRRLRADFEEQRTADAPPVESDGNFTAAPRVIDIRLIDGAGSSPTSSGQVIHSACWSPLSQRPAQTNSRIGGLASRSKDRATC